MFKLHDKTRDFALAILCAGLKQCFCHSVHGAAAWYTNCEHFVAWAKASDTRGEMGMLYRRNVRDFGGSDTSICSSRAPRLWRFC